MGKTNKKELKGLLLALAMSTALATQAFANVMPKTTSVIDHANIVVSDVFSGVTGPAASHYLAPAPQPGGTLTLSSYDLSRISSAFNLGWTPDGSNEHVVIRRASNDVTTFDIQAALAKKMQDEMDGARFDISLDGQPSGFHVPKGAGKAVRIISFSYDPAAGTFRAVVAPAAAPDNTERVTGRYCAIERIPVLNTPMNAGDVITASDIDYVDMRSTDVSSSMITAAANLIGHTPRYGLQAMRPVMASAVKMPEIIKKGELVTMTLDSNLMHLTAIGRAMDNGAVGDDIRVMNPSSKQIIDAVITGPQTVSVQSPLNDPRSVYVSGTM